MGGKSDVATVVAGVPRPPLLPLADDDALPPLPLEDIPADDAASGLGRAAGQGGAGESGAGGHGEGNQSAEDHHKSRLKAAKWLSKNGVLGQLMLMRSAMFPLVELIADQLLLGSADWE
eukprot:8076855-Pyramimonas_sp.AAC.1